MKTSSNELQTIWSQLVALATRVGEVGEQNRFNSYRIESNTQRIAALERRWDQPCAAPAGSPPPRSTGSAWTRWRAKLSPMREALGVLSAIYKVWRLTGLIALGGVWLWKWAWPLLLRWVPW